MREFLDDPIAARWQAAFRAAPEGFAWDVEHVDRRLIDAMRVLGRVVPPVRPRGYGRGSPDYLKDALDLWFEQMAEDEERARDAASRNRVKHTATLEQVTDMEAAITWPMRYLADDRAPVYVLDTFNLWLACKAGRRPFVKACKDLGIARSTATRRRWHGALIIATGLMTDGVPNNVDEAPARPPTSRPRPPADLPEWWHDLPTGAGAIELADRIIEERVRDEYAGLEESEQNRALMRLRLKFLRRRARRPISR